MSSSIHETKSVCIFEAFKHFFQYNKSLIWGYLTIYKLKLFSTCGFFLLHSYYLKIKPGKLIQGHLKIRNLVWVYNWNLTLASKYSILLSKVVNFSLRTASLERHDISEKLKKLQKAWILLKHVYRKVNRYAIYLVATKFKTFTERLEPCTLIPEIIIYFTIEQGPPEYTLSQQNCRINKSSFLTNFFGLNIFKIFVLHQTCILSNIFASLNKNSSKWTYYWRSKVWDRFKLILEANNTII